MRYSSALFGSSSAGLLMFHFPMQKSLKITFSRSSTSTRPVSRPSERAA
jgi:hypothetical protein